MVDLVGGGSKGVMGGVVDWKLFSPEWISIVHFEG